ncbi:hypothetical protein AVEN_38859-1 [Araneus ventricosus]|uniref:Uncharacterized protein n=1 Tax=Araneus ventricosus TaxID=182803 RepID=A0A4Y2A237_ARAVE|nr:hypothetical protein AVEN_38859-1 [Araneus ventricosus]
MALVPIARGFVRWLQHSGETCVNDPKVKGSGQRTVPTGSCNCVCVLVKGVHIHMFRTSPYVPASITIAAPVGWTERCPISLQPLHRSAPDGWTSDHTYGQNAAPCPCSCNHYNCRTGWMYMRPYMLTDRHSAL